MMALNKFMVAMKQVAIQFDIRNMDLSGEANSLGRSCGGVGGWGGGRGGGKGPGVGGASNRQSHWQLTTPP